MNSQTKNTIKANQIRPLQGYKGTREKQTIKKEKKGKERE